MAKKKENELSYLQMPLPQGTQSYKHVKVNWSGLNKREELDTGMLSMESNISTNEAPYLTPSQKFERLYDSSDNLITISNTGSMFGFDDFLLAVYRSGITLYAKYIDKDRHVYLGSLTTDARNNNQRSIVQFNVYNSTSALEGTYTKKLLIFPDRMSMDFNISANFNLSKLYDNIVSFSGTTEEGDAVDDGPTNSNSTITNINTGTYYQNTETGNVFKYSDSEWVKTVPAVMPPIKYATVFCSRLFGVGDGKIYASGFNDYSNWNLDTVDEYNESNAWVSASQSNVKADGVFTGITTYENHVICFKKDFMHELYNTKNPFRIQDIFAEGTIDNRTIQNVDGKLFFVSEDNVKIYTGSNPRIVSYNLNLDKITYAVSGTDDRNYYLYCEDNSSTPKKMMFTYDTYVDQWSEQEIDNRVLNFAHNKNGMYMLCNDGGIYKMDTDNYDHEWSFETDLITRQGSNPTINIKHLKKIQMFADIPHSKNSGKRAYINIYAVYDNEEFDSTSFNKEEHLLYSSINSIDWINAIEGNPTQIQNPDTTKIYKDGNRFYYYDSTLSTPAWVEADIDNWGVKTIRIKARNTSHYGMKLHIEGSGYVKIYGLELIMEAGGDLYV